MTTEQVITAFLAGRSASNGRISTDGTNLYSYSTIIARHAVDGGYWITDVDYSATTSRHISELHSALGYPAKTGARCERPVSISDDRTGQWTHADNQPGARLFGRKPRKGSVGYRPIDAMPAATVATFDHYA